MALAGKGAIIIWNDVAPEGLSEYYEWHNREHMPERLGIPGFLRGSRYVAISAPTSPAFLTIYELADRGIATSAAYLARLNAPSDWSRRTMLHFRNMIRALTEVEASAGVGPGGVAAAVRFEDGAQGEAALVKARAASKRIEEISQMPRITGVHFCVTDAGASAAKTAESRHRGDSIVAPIACVLIEGCDDAAVATAVARLLHDCGLDGAGLTVGTYRLEHAISS